MEELEEKIEKILKDNYPENQKLGEYSKDRVAAYKNVLEIIKELKPKL